MSFANLKSSRMLAALVAAMVVLTLAGAAIPAQAQTYTVVYNFGSAPNDATGIGGGGPNLIAQGRDGNFYSMSEHGGTGARGAAFKITPSGTETLLASFVTTNGLYPWGGLTLGTDGNLYGTTLQGGGTSCQFGAGCGIVLKMTPAGVLTTLFAFPATDSNGLYPYAPPIQGTDGNFYGSTPVGNGGATLYKMTPTGTMTLLHQFNVTDGDFVSGQLVQGTDGNFYGGSFQGGTSSAGVLFKVTSTGVFTLLHNFTGSDGTSAWGLIQGTDGNFYGATVGGGTSNAGVIFKITSSGAYTVLYNLNGTTDGLNPYSSLIQATDGNFYGVANAGGTLGYGTIYKITPGGAYTVVHNFDSTTGQNPQAALTQSTTGLLYGDTQLGGQQTVTNCNGTCGVFYSLNIGAAPFAKLVTTSGKEGAKIGILGQGFSSSSVVKFGGVQATSITLSGTTFITATVPAGALTGKVTVTTGSTTLTSPQSFKVKPTFTSFAPPSGPVGTPVTITGTGLTQTTKVTFNGTSAAFTVNSDTQITATVPTGATTGKITVTTKGGSVSSTTSFTVN